jgi:hypothetical protein
MSLRRVFVAGALALVLSGAAANPAGAAGGQGASTCSQAGSELSPGIMIDARRREIGGFGGNGNAGDNPGFNFAGMSSFCNPTR